MFICICNGITEDKLKQAAKGTKGHKEVLKKLGVGNNCGICLIDALEKLDLETKKKETSPIQSQTDLK